MDVIDEKKSYGMSQEEKVENFMTTGEKRSENRKTWQKNKKEGGDLSTTKTYGAPEVTWHVRFIKQEHEIENGCVKKKNIHDTSVKTK